jgi:hypothetical protein
MDAPSRQTKRRRNVNKGQRVIRRFISLLVIFVLIGSTCYNYWQVVQLRQANTALLATNLRLKTELIKHRGRTVEEHLSHVERAKDPVADAQFRVALAEKALAEGNIGDALTQCRLAGNDISVASNSSSGTVKNSLSALRSKLSVVQQQTTSLWQKLGA